MPRFSNLPGGNGNGNSNPLDDDDDGLSDMERIRKQVADTIYFRATDLAPLGVIFTLEELRWAGSRWGDGQWNLTIDIRKETFPKEFYETSGLGQGKKVVVSLPSGSRDDHMRALINAKLFPMSSCFFEIIPLTSGSEFIQLAQYKKSDPRYIPLAKPAQSDSVTRPAQPTANVSGNRMTLTEYIAWKKLQDVVGPVLDQDGNDLP